MWPLQEGQQLILLILQDLSILPSPGDGPPYWTAVLKPWQWEVTETSPEMMAERLFCHLSSTRIKMQLDLLKWKHPVEQKGFSILFFTWRPSVILSPGPLEPGGLRLVYNRVCQYRSDHGAEICFSTDLYSSLISLATRSPRRSLTMAEGCRQLC